MLIFLNLDPKYYQNKIWSNTSVVFDKHFQHVFGSMLKTSSRPSNVFTKMAI